jgi:hypothetical protein
MRCQGRTAGQDSNQGLFQAAPRDRPMQNLDARRAHVQFGTERRDEQERHLGNGRQHLQRFGLAAGDHEPRRRAGADLSGAQAGDQT